MAACCAGALATALRAPLLDCQGCGAALDVFMDHALVCPCGGDRTLRHNALRNAVCAEARSAGLGVEMGKAGLLPPRPDDEGSRGTAAEADVRPTFGSRVGAPRVRRRLTIVSAAVFASTWLQRQDMTKRLSAGGMRNSKGAIKTLQPIASKRGGLSCHSWWRLLAAVWGRRRGASLLTSPGPGRPEKQVRMVWKRASVGSRPWWGCTNCFPRPVFVFRLFFVVLFFFGRRG